MKYKTSPKLSRWVCAAHLTICLPKCDLVSLEAIWSGASLRSSGPSPAAAWFFVSLPVLPCAVQETNARLLVRLQCFDLHFQMEPEVPRHVEKTKPNFCNLQERCLRIIQIYFYMLFFFWQNCNLNQTKIYKHQTENKDCRYIFFPNPFDI